MLTGDHALAARIDALLPQTQCTRCGYPTCRAYADAIARDEADINHCPPGGAQGVDALARLLGRASKALDPANGVEAPPLVAVIDEAICIGCTKCIQACPVDAIVGAAKRMHTVIAAECTGCELCLAPCPVDCIALVAIADQPLARDGVMQRAAHARERFDARSMRLARKRAGREARRLVRGESERVGVGGADKPDSERDVSELADVETAVVDATFAPAAKPISRNAVLEAIARGKARRNALKGRAP